MIVAGVGLLEGFWAAWVYVLVDTLSMVGWFV